MAQTYRCDLCEQTTADFMITDVSDGTVIAVGVECILEWAMPIAQAYNEAVNAHQAATAAGAATDGMPEPSPTSGQQTTALDPPDAPVSPDPDWEGDYPQPAASGARRGRGASKSVAQEEPSPGTPSDDHR